MTEEGAFGPFLRLRSNMVLSETEIEMLLNAAEHLRDEARVNLMESEGSLITGLAQKYVDQSNVIRKALLALGFRAVGPEWMIENKRVVPVPGI